MQLVEPQAGLWVLTLAALSSGSVDRQILAKILIIFSHIFPKITMV